LMIWPSGILYTFSDTALSASAAIASFAIEMVTPTPLPLRKSKVFLAQ
jgi:hypothetical protein